MDIDNFTTKLNLRLIPQNFDDESNDARAEKAVILAECYGLMSGVNPDKSLDGPQTSAADMMAQFMHWAYRDGWDFEAALQTARNNFEAEVCRYCGESAQDNGVCDSCLEEQ